MKQSLELGNAQITENGVLYQNEFYSCSEAIRNNWFGLSIINGIHRTLALQETLNENNLLILDPFSRKWQLCRRIDKAIAQDREDYYKEFQALMAQRKGRK